VTLRAQPVLEVSLRAEGSSLVPDPSSLGSLEFLHSANRRASEAGDYTCSPQRKLWVQVQANPQARVAGGIMLSVPNIPLVVLDTVFPAKIFFAFP
jgi:hypothetical protein